MTKSAFSNDAEHDNLDAMLQEIDTIDCQTCSDNTDSLVVFDEESGELQSFVKISSLAEVNDLLGDNQRTESIEKYFSGETINGVKSISELVAVDKEESTPKIYIVDEQNVSGVKRKQGTHGNQVICRESFSNAPTKELPMFRPCRTPSKPAERKSRSGTDTRRSLEDRSILNCNTLL